MQCGPKKELQFSYTCTIPNNATSPPPPPPPAQLSYMQLRLPGLGAAVCLEVRLVPAWSLHSSSAVTVKLPLCCQPVGQLRHHSPFASRSAPTAT